MVCKTLIGITTVVMSAGLVDRGPVGGNGLRFGCRGRTENRGLLMHLDRCIQPLQRERKSRERE